MDVFQLMKWRVGQQLLVLGFLIGFEVVLLILFQILVLLIKFLDYLN